MKLIPIFSTLWVLLSFNSTVLADSPLTSTNFSAAYQSERIITLASKTRGKLTKELMNFLANEKNPIGLKMAVINELGWNFKGKKNSSKFLNFLISKNGYANEEDFLNKGKGDELLCMAYLKAMDNYFEVDDAIRYSDFALLKNSKSYTYQIISALIKAQKSLDSDWCQVYKLTDEVRRNTSLTIDLNNEAIKIIFDYMDNYKESCK